MTIEQFAEHFPHLSCDDLRFMDRYAGTDGYFLRIMAQECTEEMVTVHIAMAKDFLRRAHEGGWV